MGRVGRIRGFIRELKRRKVVHVGSMYLVAAWGISLGAAELFPTFGVPEWAVRYFVIGAVLGFPLALILAWVFELTTEGDGFIIDQRGADKRGADQRSANGPSAGVVPEKSEESGTTVWEARPILEVTWHDPSGERSQQFRTRCVLGRDPSVDVRFAEELVSRFHAEIRYSGNGWVIADLGSSNGVRVDGDLISEPTKIVSGAVVRLFSGQHPVSLRLIEPKLETTQLDT